jgi:hypothetical protein
VTTLKPLSITIMQSPSQTQSTSTNTNLATLSNSMLQVLSSSNAEDFPVFPITMTITSPASEAVQRERLLMILDAAIALVDDDIFDFDLNKAPDSHFDGALG